MEGAIYYVTSNASQNQVMFKDKADTSMYLELLTKHKSEHKFKLFSYCLLPDKVELLLETGSDATISEIMHDLNSIYTKYFNGRYHQKGHLFESRFRSVLVEKVNHLLQMTRFIHRSPGETFKDCSDSSFHLYRIVEAGAQSFLMGEEIKEVLSFLKSKDDPAAYERYCLEPDTDETKELEKRLRRGGILGSESFHTQVQNRIKEHTEEIRLKTKAKPNKMLIVIAGAMAVVVFPTMVLLYVSKSSLENKYEGLLKEKEAEFAEKTRFENVSPIAPTELDGTEWEIETVALPAAQATEAVKDRVRFQNGRFYSAHLQTLGFQDGTYFLVPKGNGVFNWQSAFSNAKGETVSWRGEWRGEVMKGVMSFRPATKKSAGSSSGEDFSFYSVKWSYVKHEEKQPV